MIGELGRGGMGSVYLAVRNDGTYTKQVAIKTIPRFGGRGLFQRERQILALLDHSGIARLRDGGTTSDGQPYLVMEYVDGSEISKYAHSKRVPSILQLLLQVCHANILVPLRAKLKCSISQIFNIPPPVSRIMEA